MECGLGQFVGDDVVTDHLSPSSLMPFQLALVTAAHFWIATHCAHRGLRKRCFQIVFALLALPPAPGYIPILRNAPPHSTLGTEVFHVCVACLFTYFLTLSQ